MIHIKTPEELAKMREAGRIVALAHDAVRTTIRAGHDQPRAECHL